ncbi:Crp/Fnr family transcriptional regulator [uncultured Enterovirga sp.]|uniref:Crp/Fnr family transcriptional regulator n=1 Tax=uncultured Enterovirga sp. TaxID=2026352 RepID=UPI0035CB2386
MPFLEERKLPRGFALQLPGDPVKRVYFLRRGFASILIEIGTRTMEVGLVGREGMLGLPAALGSEIAPYRAVVREDVHAYQVSVERFKELISTHPSLGAVMLRYLQAGVAQITHTAFANAHLTIAQRLARWLLMAHDRVDDDTIRVTHAVLSDALGVQRPGVTLALHELEGDRSIRSVHRAVIILDRDSLIARTFGSYGPAEAAYRQLLGPRA